MLGMLRIGTVRSLLHIAWYSFSGEIRNIRLGYSLKIKIKLFFLKLDVKRATSSQGPSRVTQLFALVVMEASEFFIVRNLLKFFMPYVVVETLKLKRFFKYLVVV